MDKPDRNTEHQVWQRVTACRAEGPRNDLRQMQREAMELAAIYRALSSRMMGGRREKMQKLYQGERANAAALAGIGYLSRQGDEHLKLWQPAMEDARKLLERCYHRTRRCMTEYLARSAEGEWGIVYDRMAKREGEHCAWIAELLGSLQ